MVGPADTLTPKAVIFDWGGVLMRTVSYEPRHRWDRELGLLEGSVEGVVHGSQAWLRVERGEITPEEYWSAIGRQLRLSSTQLSNLRRDFYSGDSLDQTLLSFIVYLRARNLKIGLLSNNSLELLNTIANYQLGDYFDSFIVSAQIGIRKPDPKAYQAILQQLGVSPSQAIYVDDSQTNVEGALALGMAAVRFQAGTDLSAIIEEWLRSSPLAPAENFAS